MLYRNRYSEGILGVCIFVVELFSDGRITEIGPIYIPSSFESGIRSLKEERLRERDIKKNGCCQCACTTPWKRSDPNDSLVSVSHPKKAVSICHHFRVLLHLPW